MSLYNRVFRRGGKSSAPDRIRVMDASPEGPALSKPGPAGIRPDEPSPEEWLEAVKMLRSLLGGSPSNKFKLCRCEKSAFEKLSKESARAGARTIKTVWSGAGGKCSAMEKILAAWAREKHPMLCLNGKDDGAVQVRDEGMQMICVILW